MPYCRRCGHQVTDQARICENCNFQLDQPYPPAASFQPVSFTPPTQGPTPTYTGWQAQTGIQAQPKLDGGSIAALVLGISGIVIWPFAIVISPIALLMGRAARHRINESRGTLTGRDFATAGYVMGIIGVVVSIIAIIVIALVVGAFNNAKGF